MNETGLVGDDPCCVMSSLNMSRPYTNFCCCGGTSIFDRGKDLARVKRRNVQFTCAKSKMEMAMARVSDVFQLRLPLLPKGIQIDPIAPIASS